MNCLDYMDSLYIPSIKGALGFSYVWNDKTNDNILARLDLYVKKCKPSYVRIVPNCQATDEEQEVNNKVLGARVDSWGDPYFYQAKVFSRPEHCWWGYFKPFILHDGWVYPCSSVVLNLDADKQFHKKYRWVRMEDYPDLVRKKVNPVSTENCNHCVFRAQNDMIDGILYPDGMEDFI